METLLRKYRNLSQILDRSQKLRVFHNCQETQPQFNFKLYYHPRKLMSKSNVLSWRSKYDTGFYNNEDMVLIRPKFFAIQIMEDIIVKGKEKTLLMNIC